MITMFVEFEFEACHRLAHTPRGHKCHRMHGHSYKVRVELTGPLDPKLGWIIDYAEVLDAWCPLEAVLDHHNLNNVLGPMSTSERLAEWIGTRLRNKIKQVSMVEVREYAHAGAIWRPDR